MLAGLTWSQFREWMAYAELDPFGEERADIRTATVVQMIANVNRDAKKHPAPWPLSDFQLRFGDMPAPAKPEQSWQQMKAIALAASIGHNKQHQQKTK